MGILAYKNFLLYSPFVGNSTFPLLSFLSDGNTDVKDERYPFIRAVLHQFSGEELRNDVVKLSR